MRWAMPRATGRACASCRSRRACGQWTCRPECRTWNFPRYPTFRTNSPSRWAFQRRRERQTRRAPGPAVACDGEPDGRRGAGSAGSAGGGLRRASLPNRPQLPPPRVRRLRPPHLSRRRRRRRLSSRQPRPRSRRHRFPSRGSICGPAAASAGSARRQLRRRVPRSRRFPSLPPRRLLACRFRPTWSGPSRFCKAATLRALARPFSPRLTPLRTIHALRWVWR